MLKRLRELLGRRGKNPPTSRATATSDARPDEGLDRDESPRPAVHVGPRVVHRPIPESDLDPDAVKIVRRLTRFDHTAYLVGGCVRDLLLDHKPKDFDIGTSATPRQIKRLFRNSRIIGRRFRLAHIYFQQGKVIEVATFRARDEVEPDDNGGDIMIRDDNVFGTSEEDALRRDFTINALFYDVNNGTVLDHSDGLDDLRRRSVRTIGDAEIRFREDPIRILRAIKFAARLDFRIESGTLQALTQMRDEISKAAPPRILEEINRFCLGGAARRSFELMRETGIFKAVLPEFHELYEVAPDSWKRLSVFLDRVDRRLGEGQVTGTGEILAILLLPLIEERIGWMEDGRALRPRGVNIRDLADAIMKPMALRLRVARKDQEACRQILMTLYRMVPSGKLRSNTRRSILGRESFPQALWILETLAGVLEGDFRKAADYWRRAVENRDVEPAQAQAGKQDGRGRSRGRRRRGPRRDGDRERPASEKTNATTEKSKTAAEKSKAAPEKAKASPARKPKRSGKKDPNMPSPWDDRYFFAALPTVPEGSATADVPENRDAAPSPEPESNGDSGQSGDGPEAPKPRRKRRRRRRRKRPAGAGTPSTEGETPTDRS